MSGQVPPLVQNASDYAYYLGADYGYRVYPAGLTGVTGTFQNSLTPGNVISMWSASDQVGHVAVVTSVNVTGGNGTITVMDENASATGADTITVSGGVMSYQGIYPDFQWTTNLPGSGNPAPGGPADLLRSGSFEGSAAGWQKFVPAGATVNMSDYNTAGGAPAIAHDGTWYLATNTSTGGGGVYQDVPVSAGPGTAYVGTAWLSSQSGTATGSLCLWGLGTSSTSTCERYKVARPGCTSRSRSPTSRPRTSPRSGSSSTPTPTAAPPTWTPPAWASPVCRISQIRCRQTAALSDHKSRPQVAPATPAGTTMSLHVEVAENRRLELLRGCPNTLSNNAGQRSPRSATVRDQPEHDGSGRW